MATAFAVAVALVPLRYASELRDGTVFTLVGDGQQCRPSGRPLVVMLSSAVCLEARPEASLRSVSVIDGYT